MVIIGGGPGGIYLTEAVHNRKGDDFKVILLEQRDSFGGSSDAGLKQFRTMQGEPVFADLVQRTVDWYKKLGKELGEGENSYIQYFPYLFLAQDPKKLAEIAVDLGKAQHAGYGDDAEIWNQNEIREHYPFVDRKLLGAIHYPDAGKLDFPRAIGEITKRAKNTTYALGTAAGDVVVKRGRVVGVQTDKGFIKTKRVVLAPGAFFLNIEQNQLRGRDVLKGGRRTTGTVMVKRKREAPKEMPVLSVTKRQSFTAPLEGLPANLQVYVIGPDGAYVRMIVGENGKGEGTYGWANPADPHITEPEVRPQATEAPFPPSVYASLGEGAMSAYGDKEHPGRLAVKPTERKAGYYTEVPDDLPIVDSTPTKGLYILAALSHAGIMSGYGAAEKMTDIVFDPTKQRRLGGLLPPRNPNGPQPENAFASDRDFGKRMGRPL